MPLSDHNPPGSIPLCPSTNPDTPLLAHPSGATGLFVHSGGWERCPPNQRIRLEVDQYCIELITAGRGTLRAKADTHELRPGLALLYGPGGSYVRTYAEAGPVCRQHVCFGGLHAVTRLQQLGLAPGDLAFAEQTRCFQSHLQEFIRCGSKDQSGSAEALVFHFDALLASFSGGGTGRPARPEGAYLTFIRCKTYLEENYLKVRRVDEVAARFGINPSYLCRLFSRFASETPHRMYERLRIEHAAHVMATRKVLVQDVAEALGMDQFHFSRVFKRVYGVSPSVYLTQRSSSGRPAELQGVA